MKPLLGLLLLFLLLAFSLAACTQVGNDGTDATTGSTADTTAAKPLEVTPNRTGEITVGGETLVLPEFDPFTVAMSENERQPIPITELRDIEEVTYDTIAIVSLRPILSGSAEYLSAEVLMTYMHASAGAPEDGYVGKTLTLSASGLCYEALKEYHFALICFAPTKNQTRINRFDAYPIKDGKIVQSGVFDPLDRILFEHRENCSLSGFFPGFAEMEDGMDVSDLAPIYRAVEEKYAAAVYIGTTGEAIYKVSKFYPEG